SGLQVAGSSSCLLAPAGSSTSTRRSPPRPCTVTAGPSERMGSVSDMPVGCPGEQVGKRRRRAVCRVVRRHPEVGRDVGNAFTGGSAGQLLGDIVAPARKGAPDA